MLIVFHNFRNFFIELETHFLHFVSLSADRVVGKKIPPSAESSFSTFASWLFPFFRGTEICELGRSWMKTKFELVPVPASFEQTHEEVGRWDLPERVDPVQVGKRRLEVEDLGGEAVDHELAEPRDRAFRFFVRGRLGHGLRLVLSRRRCCCRCRCGGRRWFGRFEES